MSTDDSPGSGDTNQRLSHVSELAEIIAYLVTSAAAIATASTSIVQAGVFIVALTTIVSIIYLSCERAICNN